MEKYTVIGHYTDNGQIFCDVVLARNGLHAFAQVAKAFDSPVEFTVAIYGVPEEATGDLTFPGETLVDAETILHQPEVFGEPT